MASGAGSEKTSLCSFPWVAPPAPQLPEGATKEERKLYFQLCEKANKAHKATTSWQVNHRLVRDDDQDPATLLPICKKYLLANQATDPDWLAKIFAALLYANKAYSCTPRGQYYLAPNKYDQVRQD
jgi:hypothetical protein